MPNNKKILYIMKKIKVFSSALEIRPASTIFGTEFQAVKLSFEQAMAFNSGFHSFEHMLRTYGKSKVLTLGEQYDGYVAVYYNEWQQDVIRLRGAVVPFSESEILNMMPSALRDAALKNAAYKVVYNTAGGEQVQGAALYVWTFSGCNFARHIHALQTERKMSLSICPDVLDASIKNKIFQSLTADETVSITEDEDDVLLSYLGKPFYMKFIVEVPDEE